MSLSPGSKFRSTPEQRIADLERDLAALRRSTDSLMYVTPVAPSATPDDYDAVGETYPAFASPWTNISGKPATSFGLRRGGLWLNLICTGGEALTNSTIFTLPVAYRPAEGPHRRTAQMGVSGESQGVVDVNTDGTVVFVGLLSSTGGGGGGGSVATDTVFDAKGDLVVGLGADSSDNLAVGANGQVLQADSTQTLGVKWAAVVESSLSLSDNTTNNVTSSKHGFAPKGPADVRQFLNGALTPTWARVKDSDLQTSDVTTNDVSITKHGFAPKAPNDATKYLDGSGAYSTPPGSGAAGELMISDTPSNPLVFDDIVQTDDGTDFVYSG